MYVTLTFLLGLWLGASAGFVFFAIIFVGKRADEKEGIT